MWKDKGLQLVMLPTKENAKEGEYSLLLGESGKVYLPQAYTDSFKPQHLYLLSDEEIKEGDINTSSDFWDFSLTSAEDLDVVNDKFNGYRKVIACNNPSLNLPQFPSSFLEEYVKRYNSKNSLEVEVDHNEVVWQQSSDRYDDNDVYCNGEKVASFDYRLQEEEMDRFTDRLGKQPKVISDNTISIRFKEEKMYNRSEVEKLCGNAFDAGEAYRTGSCEGFKQIHPNKYEWIKENLK